MIHFIIGIKQILIFYFLHHQLIFQQFTVYFYAIDRKNYSGNIQLPNIVTNYVGLSGNRHIFMNIVSVSV